MLVGIAVNNQSYRYYNEIYKSKNEELLSENTISLIILTTTGDKKFLNSFLNEIYKELNITHLLVLSGSNLVIFSSFFSLFLYRNRLSSLFIIVLALLVYFCYISFLHPVARALVFMLFYEYIIFFGLKYSRHIVILMISILCLLVLFLLDFSNSFLLSLLFSILIVIYNFVSSPNNRVSSTLLKNFLFPFYMTITSAPIQLYFFGIFNFRISLFSNLLIVSSYDYLVFLLYFSYFIGFIDPLSVFFLPLVDSLINFYLKYLSYLLYLIRIYN